MQNADSVSPKARCAICDKAVSAAYKPFCSKRCADVDLHRWLSGGYAIAGQDDESAADEVEDPARER